MKGELSHERFADMPLSKRVRVLSMEKTVCARCDARYIRSENFGRWQCRQHLLPEGEDGTHPCCGKRAGCVEADHVDGTSPRFRYDETDDEWVDFGALLLLEPKKESVVESRHEGLVVSLKIRRFRFQKNP